MCNRMCRRLAALTLLCLGAGPATAQWITQQLTLNPGWNAVFLEVQPEPAEGDVVFNGLPVESVWRWNRRFRPVQFVQDPATLTPSLPDWLVYLPGTHPLAGRSTLHAVEGGRPYLIKLPNHVATVTWRVHGRAVVRSPEWITDSLTFAGFSLPAGSSPTFTGFFSGSPAHRNGPIYRLSPAGLWGQVTPSTAMQPGEAFWIRTRGVSDYPGPLAMGLEQSPGLDFGSVLQEQTMMIKNRASTPQTVSIRRLDSELPATSDWPALAGPVPLSHWVAGAAVEDAGWTALPTVLTRANLEPGETWTVRMAVRRADMAPLAGPVGPAGAAYQSILEVSDEKGLFRRLIPVTALGAAESFTGVVRRQGLRPSQMGAPEPGPGLWVGHAVLTAVSPAAASGPAAPTPAPAAFQFRLLLHRDAQGDVRLLQRVVQMWKPGTYKPDPTDPTQNVVDEPGRFVLLTDDSLMSGYAGATLRDGSPAGRRFSSAAFAFRDPLLLTPEPDAVWRGTVDLNHDDPLNPFKHLHHPDHDNWDQRYEQELDVGRESFRVVRQIRLEFMSGDPEGLTIAGWGDNQVGGLYEETMTGLHRLPIMVSGTFRLHHASREARLNDQD